MRKKLAVFLIVLCSFLGYCTSLFNGFVYDDHMVLTGNRFIKNIHNVPRLFTNDYFLVSKERTFRPFSPLILFLQYSVFGDNPAGYHAVNIVVHTLNGILLFLLLLNLGYRDKTSLLASLVFCAHPAVSETVFCVSYMEDLWGMLFYLASFLFFIKYRKQKPVFLILIQVCLFLSLLCKEMGITAYVLIPLMEIVFYGKFSLSKKRFLFFYIPSVITAVFYFLLRFHIFYLPEKEASYPGGSFLVTLANIPRIFLHYLRLCLMPVKLTADYNIKIYPDIFSIPVICSYFLAGVLVYLFFRLSKKNKFWALFFIINFLPVSNIIPFGATFAERYLYFPIIGFAVLVPVFIQKMNKPHFKIVKFNEVLKYAVFLAVLFFYIILLNERAPFWKSDESLWIKTYKSSPKGFTEKATFYVNLGNVYYRKNQLDKALQAYLRAKKINPDLPGLYNNIGVIYMEKGQHDIAKSYFFKDIDMRGSLEGAYLSLFKLYMREKNYVKAEKVMLDFLAKNPESLKAFDNLSAVYNEIGDYQRALDCVKQSLLIDSKHEAGYFNGYIVYMMLNKPGMAEKILKRGLKELPTSVTLKNALAEKYRLEGSLYKSLAVADEIVNSKTADAKTYVIRGIVYHILKKPELAKLDFEKSLDLNPNQVKVLNNLGLIYYDEGSFDKARQCWLKSLKLNPNQENIKKSMDHLNSRK